MVYLIDTAKAIREIESTGLSHDQAEAIVGVFTDVGETIATKDDIKNLKVYIRYHILIGAGIVIAGLKTLEYLGV